MRTVIEPYRIKSVERIKITTEAERVKQLEQAKYNVFKLPAAEVMIDLLTDSGTGAMSDEQWGAMMVADESYAFAKSYYKLEKQIKHIFGYKYFLPVHQGRAAEKILFSNVLSDILPNGKYKNAGANRHILSNTHFDTTRANIEFNNGTAVDLLTNEGLNPASLAPFKGNMDIEKMRNYIKKIGRENIPLCMLTITNNSNGGQPVSMANIKAVSEECKKHNIPLFLDACRFAENAYFIKMREEGYQNKSIVSICQEMFSYSDGCTFSAKKDAIVNMGGILAMNNATLYEQCKNILIITEGFESYGGLAGRDLEAMAQGLVEVVEESYLHHRIHSVNYLGTTLQKMGIPLVQPIGGHAVYVDVTKFLPHIEASQFPGIALVCALYQKGGIRACEIGSVMFGYQDASNNFIPSPMELVRLAIPRRVYTQSHIDYVIETFEAIQKITKTLRGYKMTKSEVLLRHFTAEFTQV